MNAGLVVFVPCVQFGSNPYPFRMVLRFNVRFDVVTPQQNVKPQKRSKRIRLSPNCTGSDRHCGTSGEAARGEPVS